MTSNEPTHQWPTLSPCPFCGVTEDAGALKLRDYQRVSGIAWFVDCTTCGATGGSASKHREAIAMWNRRTSAE